LVRAQGVKLPFRLRYNFKKKTTRLSFTLETRTHANEEAVCVQDSLIDDNEREDILSKTAQD